ncbi:MAG: SRPBCC family protein, partial [Acidiferrobacter sp.]
QLVLDVPLKRIWTILTDYPQIKRLNPSVQQSRVIRRDGLTLLRMRIRSCVLFICFPVTQTESMTTRRFVEIRGVIIPTLSSFRSGVSRWRLAPVKRGTRITFQAVLVPSFYIPPILDSWIIKRKLTAEMRATADHLATWAGAKRPYKA